METKRVSSTFHKNDPIWGRIVKFKVMECEIRKVKLALNFKAEFTTYCFQLSIEWNNNIHQS